MKYECLKRAAAQEYQLEWNRPAAVTMVYGESLGWRRHMI